MRLLLAPTLALAFAFQAGIVAPLLAQQPPVAVEAPETFPDHPGREDTFYYCAACHSFQLVGRQGMTRERWAETLSWMTDKHSMPKLEGKDLDVILDYLAKAYPESAKPQGGWKNPFIK